jgi:hypothetical protein
MAKKKNIQFTSLDPMIGPDIIEQLEKGERDYNLLNATPLIKGIMSSMERTSKVQSVAFTEDPNTPNKYAGIYYEKSGLLPDRILKRVAVTDDLVSTILNIRANQSAMFGRILENRFTYGFRVEPFDANYMLGLSEEDRKDLTERIKKATKTIFTCGSTKNIDEEERMTLPEFLYLSARNGILFGRFATEILFNKDSKDEKEFHSFRPRDAGTIYKALPNSDEGNSIRKEAITLLSRIKNEKLDPKKFEQDEYTWFQVIEGRPIQGFGPEEMLVHNCYPTTDIELNGYPITPIDSAFAAVTTHINITNHNKLYFQNGRAAKGMLVIGSDEVDAGTLADLKQSFNAAINSVANAWRTPVFKVGKEDTVEWKSIDAQGRDMEFQTLFDSNCRIVMAAFQVSPDEVPGYSHLSRGTNNQALSESNNEYKLEAHRDVGIRPLLNHLSDFLTFKILPLVDKDLAEFCVVRFHGLETDSPEKERTAIQEFSQIWGTMDDVHRKVEKEPYGKQMGGEFPMNPAFQQILDKYLTVGEIKEFFFGIKGASDKKANPADDYRRDPFYFQQVQFVMQQQQMEEQKKMAEQQIAQQQQQGQQPQQGQPQGQQPQQGQPQGQQPGAQNPDELTTGLDQALAGMMKTEQDIPLDKKNLLLRHNSIVKEIMDSWEKESERALAEIANVVDRNIKK